MIRIGIYRLNFRGDEPSGRLCISYQRASNQWSSWVSNGCTTIHTNSYHGIHNLSETNYWHWEVGTANKLNILPVLFPPIRKSPISNCKPSTAEQVNFEESLVERTAGPEKKREANLPITFPSNSGVCMTTFVMLGIRTSKHNFTSIPFSWISV